MRKILLMAMILLGGAFSLCVYADEPINVPLQFINEEEISQGNTKAPMRPLFITQDGNILTLAATPVDYTLVLYDENGTVTYSTLLPAGTTQVILPTTLSGTYEIRLVAETYYYIGYIEL
jgi:hypothetical protein